MGISTQALVDELKPGTSIAQVVDHVF